MTMIVKSTSSLALRMAVFIPVAAAFTHVAATLVQHTDVTASAYTRLSPLLPLNAMTVLPAVTPANAPLPFLNPAFHYAMCRFDSRSGPIALSIKLIEAGWNFTIYDMNGTSLHASNGVPDRMLDIAISINPSEDRFFGLQLDHTATSSDAERPRIRVAADLGVAVLRAPDRGVAYTDETRRQLDLSVCTPELKQR